MVVYTEEDGDNPDNCDNPSPLYWVQGPFDWEKASSRKHLILMMHYIRVMTTFEIKTLHLDSIVMGREGIYLRYRHLGRSSTYQKALTASIREWKEKGGSKKGSKIPLNLEILGLQPFGAYVESVAGRKITDSTQFPEWMFLNALGHLIAQTSHHPFGDVPNLNDLWMVRHGGEGHMIYAGLFKERNDFPNWDKMLTSIAVDLHDETTAKSLSPTPEALYSYIRHICKQIMRGKENENSLKEALNPLWRVIFGNKNTPPKTILNKLTTKFGLKDIAESVLSMIDIAQPQSKWRGSKADSNDGDGGNGGDCGNGGDGGDADSMSDK